MQDLIKSLAEAWGPSGYEHRVRAQIRELVQDYADEITVDPLGNLICRIGTGGKRVMIAAHMDEIGVMPLYQEPSGYLRFENLGGLLHTSLLGKRVIFEDGSIGVIGVHDQFGASRTKSPDLDGFFLDVSDGATDTARYIGKPAKFEGNVHINGSRVIGRALDDRVGCAVAIEAMRRINKQTENTLFFVFTVQEELGVRGARAAAYGVHPEIGIAIDVTGTGDNPHNLKMAVKLGGGAAIKHKDLGLIVPPHISAWMENTAQAQGIPFQRELLTMGQTDAAAIQLAHEGVPSGAISIPCRYIHTPSEMVDLADVEACVALTVALLQPAITL